jgi:AraC-like DNA-binding protein
MYPIKLDFEKGTVYYREQDCFTGAPQHLVHAYPHPNYKMKMHSHQFCEINVITQGEGRHYIGDTSLPARVGDVFIIPPEVPHGYYAEQTLDIAHILLRDAFLARYREELAELPAFSLLFDIEPEVRRTSGRSYNLQISAHKLFEINGQIERIVRAERTKEYAYANVLTLGFIGRLGELLRKEMQKGTLERTEILQVMEFIRENPDQKLTLSLLAEKANMSVATLTRHFREVLQTSPMQYVTACRISLARELLATGKLNKTEIAHSCGFFDVSHMNKYL